ncbi:MAG: hypothetical protein ABSA68_19770, partial [Xanthobacteraceae bacterium]
SLELPHHCPLPPLIASSPVNHGSRITSTDFCNKIGPYVIHGAAKVWSLSDQQRTNCAVGLDWLRSV